MSGAEGPLLQQAGILAGDREALRLSAEKIAHSYLRGPHGRRRAGQGERFWQFRPYHAGDMPRDIDWRQTAKRDDVFVREREHEAAQSLWIYRDASPSMDFCSVKNALTKAAYAELLVLTLGWLALEAGERVGALGASSQARSHINALPQIQHMLDGVPEISAALQPAATRPQAVLASDFYFDLSGVDDFCAGIAARGGRAILLQVCDPAEESMAWNGRIRFDDIEDANPGILIDDVAAIRADYIRAFQEHRGALAEIAKRHGGALIAASTAETADVTLERCLTALRAG